MTPKAKPAVITGTVASPSSPSVRFTAFDVPTITRSAKTIQNHPRRTSQPFRKGIARSVVKPSAGNA